MGRHHSSQHIGPVVAVTAQKRLCQEKAASAPA
jgi:hypothetical protein